MKNQEEIEAFLVGSFSSIINFRKGIVGQMPDSAVTKDEVTSLIDSFLKTIIEQMVANGVNPVEALESIGIDAELSIMEIDEDGVSTRDATGADIEQIRKIMENGPLRMKEGPFRG